MRILHDTVSLWLGLEAVLFCTFIFFCLYDMIEKSHYIIKKECNPDECCTCSNTNTYNNITGTLLCFMTGPIYNLAWFLTYSINSDGLTCLNLIFTLTLSINENQKLVK